MKISVGKIRALIITIALIAALFGTSQAQEAIPVTAEQIAPARSDRSSSRPRVKKSEKQKVTFTNERIELPKNAWAPVARIEPTALAHVGGGTFEKSIAVDPRVNVSLCVTQGNVKINGWSRNEVRVFVREGSKIGFNILQKSRQNDMPVWIKVVGSDPARPAIQRECIWGDDVEIDLPAGGVINMEGKATRLVVDSIRKISVKNGGGDISIRNVTEGVNAQTNEGDVDIENCDGMITLNTTTGNVLAFESGPSQVGDIFTAKTFGGKIALQNLEHRQIDVNSISGSVLFSGKLQKGGIYGIKTSNGSLVLNIPPDPPCLLSATYGEGDFDSELPFKLLTENVTPGPIRSIKAKLGEGDCRLNLSTVSGFIRLRKQ